jgi:hypothetical protein
MHNKIGYICLSGIRGWSSLGDAKRTSSRARHLVRHAQEDTHISTRDIREGSAALQHMESFSEHQRCKKDRLVPETHAGAPALPCRTHKELNTILQPTSKRTYLRSLGKERSFQSGLVAGYPVELRCIDVFQEQKVQQKNPTLRPQGDRTPHPWNLSVYHELVTVYQCPPEQESIYSGGRKQHVLYP